MTLLTYIEEQKANLDRELNLKRQLEKDIESCKQREKEINTEYTEKLKEFKKARGFITKDKTELAALNIRKIDYLLLKRQLEKEFDNGPGLEILKKYDNAKDVLQKANKINNKLMAKRILSILVAALKEYYRLDKNKNVPYHYKKVVNGLNNIINDDGFRITHYFDVINNSEFTISYHSVENTFTIYKDSDIADFKLLDTPIATKSQLVNRVKKADKLMDKIKELNSKINELEDNIDTLTEYTFRQ